MQAIITMYEHTVSHDENGEPYEAEAYEVGPASTGFRELVELFDQHYHLSCSESCFSTRDWAEAEADEDYRTGDRTYTSLHLVSPDDAKAARFWLRAMRFSRARQKARDLRARERSAAIWQAARY